MRFVQRIMIAAAAATVVAVAASPARAHLYNGNASNMFMPTSQSYSGAYPVTITHSQFSNGTGCLTLSGSGSSGSASLVFSGQKYPYGSFLVMDDILMVTIQEPLYGQNGGLMFVAHANRGLIGHGIFENVEGGSNFDVGHLAFGAKNGC